MFESIASVWSRNLHKHKSTPQHSHAQILLAKFIKPTTRAARREKRRSTNCSSISKCKAQHNTLWSKSYLPCSDRLFRHTGLCRTLEAHTEPEPQKWWAMG